MLRDAYIRDKVYASCLWVFRNLATWIFRFRGFKDRKTLRECIEASQTNNKVQRWYLEVEKQEATYESQISRLKCNKHCTGDVFKKLNQSSKVRLIFLEVLKHAKRCGWRFCKVNKRYRWYFLRLKANKKGNPDVFTGSTALTNTLLIHFQFKMSKQW